MCLFNIRVQYTSLLLYLRESSQFGNDQFPIMCAKVHSVLRFAFNRRIFTDQAKQWLEQLKKEDVPVILCLTFADELYLHFIGTDKDNPEPTEYKRREIGHELEVGF